MDNSNSSPSSERGISIKKFQDFFKTKLGTDRKWALGALVRIYANQTDSEKVAGQTIKENGWGFTKFDGEELSAIAREYLMYKTISEDSMRIVMYRLPKYWKQVYKMADKRKTLHLMVDAGMFDKEIK